MQHVHNNKIEQDLIHAEFAGLAGKKILSYAVAQRSCEVNGALALERS